MLDSDQNIAELRRRFGEEGWNFKHHHEIASSSSADLYYLEKPSGDRLPYLRLVTDRIVADVELSGLVSTIRKIEGDKLRDVLVRDVHDNVFLSKENLGLDLIVNSDASDKQTADALINHVYRQGQLLANHEDTYTQSKDFIDRFFERLVEFNSLKSRRDIIVDRDDSVLFTRWSEGCLKNLFFDDCTDHEYCPLFGGGKQYSNQDAIEGVDMLVEFLDKYHKRTISQFRTLEIVTSDLATFLLPGGSFEPYQAIRYAKKTLNRKGAQIDKIGAFMHFGTLLWVFENMGASYLHNSLLRLKAEGLNRVYLGYETANLEGSKKFGKEIKSELKDYMIDLIQTHNIYVKAIIQVGALGSKFYTDEGKRVFSKTALRETIASMNKVRPYRVMVSEIFEYNGFDLERWMHKNNISKYVDFERGIINEKELIKNNMLLLRPFESAPLFVRGRLTRQRYWGSEIEWDYQRFLPGYVAPVIKANFNNVFSPYKIAA
ncbi:MAG: hypothetical protein U9O94_06945 [Nanoarchaeota archaeon]|nr:hypothetical protein [Nanoarchaeota archaeon]